MSDVLVGPGTLSVDHRPPPGRTLGDGRHPVAAGQDGYAVIYVEPEGATPRIAIRDFDAVGIPCNAATSCGVDTTVGEDATPVVDAHPVVAALPDGEYITAFVEFGGDGDGLGVAMQLVVPGEATQPAVSFMNQATLGAQYDPDLVWTGEEVVGAYVDSSNLDTAPDIRWRRFNNGAGATEEVLAGTTAAEFNVALTATTDGFAAAWRESSGFEETVRVRRYGEFGTVEWSVAQPFSHPTALIVLPLLNSTNGTYCWCTRTRGLTPRVRATSDVSATRSSTLMCPARSKAGTLPPKLPGTKGM